MSDNETPSVNDHHAHEWYVRADDETVYGPLPLSTLYEWACQNRVSAGNQASNDQEDWVPVESIGELKMHWTVSSETGQTYGPFNLSAVPYLVDQGLLDPSSVVKSQASGRSLQVRSLLRLGYEPTLSFKEPPPTETEEAPELEEPVPDVEPAEQHHVVTELRELLRVEDDLELLDAVVRLQQQLEDSQRTVDELQQDIESAERSSARLHDELADDRESYASRIDDLTRQLNDAKRELGQTRAASAGMKKEIAEVQCRYSLSQKRQSERVSVLEKHVAALDSKARALKQERDGALRRLAEQGEQLTDLEILEASLAARNQELERLQAEVESARAERDETVEQTKALLTDLKHDAERARREAATVREQQEAHDREQLARITALEEAKTAADDRAEELEETVHTLIGTRNELAARAADLERRRVTTETHAAKLAETLSDYEEVSTALRAQTASLEALQHEHEALGRSHVEATAVLGDEIVSLREQLETATTEAQRLQTELTRNEESVALIRDAAAESNRQLTELRLSLQGLTEERNTLRQRADALLAERDAAHELAKGNDELRDQLKSTHERIQALQRELEAARTTSGSAEEALTREKDSLRAELERLREESRSAAEGLARDRDKVQAEDDRLRAELQEARAELHERPASPTGNDAAAREEINRLKETLTAQENALRQLQDSLKIVTRQRDSIAERSSQLTREKAKLEQRLGNDTRNSASLTTKLQQQQEEALRDLQRQHAAALEERDRTEQGLREEVEAIRQNVPNEVTTLKAMVSGRDEALAALREQHAEAMAQRERKIGDLQHRLKALEQHPKPGNTDEAEARLRAELADASSALADLRAQHETVVAERDEALAHLNTADKSHPIDNAIAEDELRREIRSLRQEVERATSEAFELREARDVLSDRVSDLAARVAQQGPTDGDLTQQVIALTHDRDDLARSVDASKHELRAMRVAAEAREEELLERIDELDTAYRQAVQQVEYLKRELATLNADLPGDPAPTTRPTTA